MWRNGREMLIKQTRDPSLCISINGRLFGGNGVK
jgi:hypothetical protein